MPSLNIENIPDALYSKLVISAEKNNRDLNTEVLFCLEKALSVADVDPDALLDRLRSLRAKKPR
ncbi:MAG: DNA-binding protein [SAR202 cluster bacterium]|jgi:plasmid stability protein|nr:DNA-binding protein [SAR202 cluster bacterium]